VACGELGDPHPYATIKEYARALGYESHSSAGSVDRRQPKLGMVEGLRLVATEPAVPVMVIASAGFRHPFIG
jgi:hypothetical protein